MRRALTNRIPHSESITCDLRIKSTRAIARDLLSSCTVIHLSAGDGNQHPVSALSLLSDAMDEMEESLSDCDEVGHGSVATRCTVAFLCSNVLCSVSFYTVPLLVSSLPLTCQISQCRQITVSCLIGWTTMMPMLLTCS